MDIKLKLDKQKKHQMGFTLIETFVAVSILAIAVIGPLSLLSRAIADSNYARDQITAYYLAQEGIELVISKRDQNVNSGNWNILGACLDNECIWDATMSDPLNFNNNSQLYRDTNGLYVHDSDGEATTFTRVIEVEELSTAPGVLVTSTVGWRVLGGNERTFSLSVFLAKN